MMFRPFLQGCFFQPIGDGLIRRAAAQQGFELDFPI
jgi:hypothetical protein